MSSFISRLFGSSAEKQEAAKTPRATVSLFDLGKDGTPDAIAAQMENFGSLYGGAPESFIKGAIEAFRSGKPENLQTLIDGNHTWQNYASSIVNAIKLGLQPEEIKIAISAMPPEKQQDILDSSVAYCVMKSFLEEKEDMILQSLVDAGAKVGARSNYALQEAANNGRIKAADFIIKNGGDYADAINNAKSFNDSKTVAALLTLQVRRENGILQTENAAMKSENADLKNKLTPKIPPYTT